MPVGRFWFRERRRPAEPFAFVSYGMTRSGSTLAFQLARVALLQAGFDQPLVPFPNRLPTRKINFIDVFDEAHERILRDFIAELGHPIVIKTHSRPDPPLVRMVERGEARAHATFRDPRDIALSLLDKGRAARKVGTRAFSEMATLDDTMRGLDNQFDTLSTWLQLPGVRRLPYDLLAFDTLRAAEAVLEHLGIRGSPKRIVKQVLKREFVQRNKAVRDRHKTEMTPADNDRFREAYAPFFDMVHNSSGDAGQLPPNTRLTAAKTPPAPSKIRQDNALP